MNTYVVEKEQAGIRLDKVIHNYDNKISRVMIIKQIQDGKVSVNKEMVNKPSFKVKWNDVIRMEEVVAVEIDVKAQEIPIEILHEDDDIIVVNKPKGMVVHPGNGNPDNTLVNAVMAICKESLSGIGGQIRPGIIHRLDKDTSGVLIVAKNDYAHINISDQIKNRQTKKIYTCLVRGVVKENEATINLPIARSDKDRKKMAVSKKGKEAISEFQVRKRYKDYTLLEVVIKTGRTHQIRVHLSHIGYPVVGDMVYSNGKNPFGVKGQMLHAKSIEFIHPRTNKEMSVQAEIPEYFRTILEGLE